MPKAPPQYFVLERCDPARNMARFYVLSVEPSLLGGATLVREWGRLGTAGQRKIEVYDSEGRAVGALMAWLQRKRGRGYRVRVGTEPCLYINVSSLWSIEAGSYLNGDRKGDSSVKANQRGQSEKS